MVEIFPKWLCATNQLIYFHRSPFCKSSDYGLYLKNVRFGRHPDTGEYVLYWTASHSEAYATDGAGAPTYKLGSDDFTFPIGGVVSIRRNPKMKKDGFSNYVIYSKNADSIFTNYQDIAGEEVTVLWLK